VHVVDLPADLLDEALAPRDFGRGEAILGRVGLDCADGLDEVGEVFGEGGEGGFEVGAGRGKLGGRGGGGERADAQVRGEEGTGGLELGQDISVWLGCRLGQVWSVDIGDAVAGNGHALLDLEERVLPV
jgi:hypothetical protein